MCATKMEQDLDWETLIGTFYAKFMTAGNDKLLVIPHFCDPHPWKAQRILCCIQTVGRWTDRLTDKLTYMCDSNIPTARQVSMVNNSFIFMRSNKSCKSHSKTEQPSHIVTWCNMIWYYIIAVLWWHTILEVSVIIVFGDGLFARLHKAITLT